MEYLKLIGIAIIVLGFALKFDVLATVLLAGLDNRNCCRNGYTTYSFHSGRILC